MDYEIRPEPTPAEREALIAALERLLAYEGGLPEVPAAYRSKWRQAGLRESVGDEGGSEPRPL